MAACRAGLKMSELNPTPELPDDTSIDRVRLPTRIKNVLKAAALKTAGAVRDTPDRVLLTFQDLGPGSVAHLRETLGPASRDGVRLPPDLGQKAKR